MIPDALLQVETPSGEPSDESLYFRYLDGQEDALRLLLERRRESLVLFLFAMVGNMEDAEDLMMDAFAVLLSKKRKFEGRSSFKTWLFAIGRNLARSHLRKKHLPMISPEELETLLSQESAELSLLRAERQRQLYAALYRLKAEYRDALFMTCFEGLSHQETGRVMGKTEKQVTDLVYRGKAALKTELEKEGFAYADD